MKQLTIGILAHVDAGKTTLSEGILFACGKIDKPGRVDNRDAYLDTDERERARGITIFSKQALFDLEGIRVTLLDTPGHVDFSAEMERVLQVLDYAILVVSGADGVQGHTRTLWQLFDRYQLPVFVFVNKMDQPGTDRGQLMLALRQQLGDGCVDMGTAAPNTEQLAMCEESLLEEYLATGRIGTLSLKTAIWNRKVFPAFLLRAPAGRRGCLSASFLPACAGAGMAGGLWGQGVQDLPG
jgi:ribosomal protection tetracycline resistance protein